MTDELYDYFGGNASKKVEPIEDDDAEVNEPEAAAESEASGGPADEKSETTSAAPEGCLLYTSPSPRDQRGSRMPSSA